MAGPALKVMSPRKVDDTIRLLIKFLGLEESAIVLMKYTAPAAFSPEPQNCHFNVWVQCDKAGGRAQHGWILAQDRQQDFAEAQFHTVWHSPCGSLRDLTPRPDGEKRLMFIPDSSRRIALTDHNGAPAIITYDNIRVHRGNVISGITKLKLIPQSDMIYEHGLAFRPGRQVPDS